MLFNLVPTIFVIFNRDAYEDLDGGITKSACESKSGRIDKMISGRIRLHSDLNWLEFSYETNKLKFKSGRHKVQSVQFKENL